MDIFRNYVEQLNSCLFKGKAIIITGARQVGKTTLLQNTFGTRTDTLWLNADEAAVRESFSELNVSNLQRIVGTYRILIIDEVQRIKNAGLMLKLLVDNFKNLQVIATGSSSIDISETIFEPLTGRHFLFHMYPFSLAELYKGKSPFEVEKALDFHLIYGSYPEVTIRKDMSAELLKNLSNQYLYKDVLIWEDLRKPELLDKLLKLLAHQIGSEVSLNELGNQLKVKSETVERYITLLEKSFVLFRLSSFSTNERKEVTKMNKVYFWDNGVRNAVIENLSELHQRRDQGPLWENFMIAERMKMKAWSQSQYKSFFWRNYNQSEVDYVETLKDEIAAYEMKWNPSKSAKVTAAFTNSYPNATAQVISPKNFTPFCGL
jgi:predicted AAA+ superfamily ATPase